MNEDSGVTYFHPYQIGDTITGLGVGVIVDSKNPKFKKGTYNLIEIEVQNFLDCLAV